ncbi:MAG: hypothetical protein IID37_06480, partial [Planctomycetes bacterium]|nr:hypothetical protein [Planctomycetota bacterium]
MIVPRYATTCMAGLALWCASTPSSAQTYSLTPVGDLPGQSFASWGTRLNNNDHITGESISADSGVWVEAFHWDTATIIPLGSINPTPFFTKGKDVNDLDEVTGWSLTDDGWQGFFWDSGGGMIGIGYDGACAGGEGPTFTSYGEGINNFSQVVGTTSTATNCGEAFIWSGGTFTNLLGFLSGDVESGAYDLNDASPVQVVGRSIDAFGKRQAMIWDSVNGMVALTSLSGYDESDAVAVNDLGDVVGICYDNVNGVNMATTWLTSNGMAPQALGYVNTGDYISQCWDINNSVEVVGESSGSSGGVGFIWDSVNGLRDLNNHLDGSGAGWQLWWARGINQSGHISGTGTNPAGDTEAYLLQPVGDDGACCIPGVGCFVTSEDDCVGQGGTFLGGGTDCGPPDPCLAGSDGACCDVPGVGCFVTTEDDCLGAGGTYQGDGTTCNPDPCLVTGACCTEDAAGNPICIDTNQDDCDSMMGFYQGDGTTCDPDPCDCTEPPVDMIAWWPLDEVAGTVAEDILIFSNDGTHVGPIPPLPTPAPGMVAGALEFDGVDDEVRVPDDSVLNFNSLSSGAGDFSIDAWIFADTFSVTHAPIVDKRDGKTGYYFYLLDGNPSLMLADNGTAPGWTEFCCGGPLILPGTWRHVAVTVDRDDPAGIKFYVDGVLAPPPTVGDPTLRPGDLTNPDDLLIGAAAYTYTPGDGRPFFDGRIDEVEIFRGAITAAEIFAIYNAGHAGKCKPDDGACCIQGLPCQILGEDECLAQGGVFQGAGTDCDPDPCVLTGACCTEDADGTPLCIEVSAVECEAVMGIYYGDGTSCTPDPCLPHGACCVEIAGVSTCIELLETDCDDLMGIYQGDGTTCVPDDPCTPIGACCAEDAAGNPFCIETTEADCDDLMGVYQGDGTTCTPDPCLVGACCIDDGAGGTFCIETTVDDCLSQNGIYQGDGTTCTPDDPCEPEVGACCQDDGSCIDGLSAGECEDQFGGTYLGDGTTCADAECVGACCFQDGSCIDAISPIECQSLGGDFQGVGVLCADVTCPAPIGACCVFDPATGEFVCNQTTFIECEAVGGTYLGDGVPCDPDPCNPDPTGACCIETQPGCIITTPDNCEALGGFYNGDDTTCDDILCPKVCELDLSTGTTNGLPDPFGAVDPDWTVNFTPTSGAGPAYSIAPVTAWVTTSGANWIDPFNTGGSGSSGYDPVGAYEFQIQFTLDFATQQDFVLSIDVAADNASSYFLNGNPIGSSTGFGALNTVSTTNQAFFLDGLNTLVATASNSSLWMGLLVDGDVTWRCVAADLSTGTTGGTVDPFGTIDPDWTVNFTPTTGIGPAFSIAPVSSWVNTAGANWIDPYNTGGSGGSGFDPFGNYQFQIQFTLDFATQSNFDLTIDTAVDNAATFFLNGNSIGSPAGFGTLTTLNTSNQSFFVNGVNTLTANVFNAGLWMGLLVDGEVTADCGEAQIGACCIDDPDLGPICIELTPQECEDKNGIYQGDGVTCAEISCDPTGACCTEDDFGNPLCFETTEDDCDDQGGLYLGDGTDCDVDPPPCPLVGACCTEDAAGNPICFVTTEDDCDDQGGLY